jgi:hypothetical protein
LEQSEINETGIAMTLPSFVEYKAHSGFVRNFAYFRAPFPAQCGSTPWAHPSQFLILQFQFSISGYIQPSSRAIVPGRQTLQPYTQKWHDGNRSNYCNFLFYVYEIYKVAR